MNILLDNFSHQMFYSFILSSICLSFFPSFLWFFSPVIFFFASSPFPSVVSWFLRVYTFFCSVDFNVVVGSIVPLVAAYPGKLSVLAYLLNVLCDDTSKKKKIKLSLCTR
jgi:hypothetical protein